MPSWFVPPLDPRVSGLFGSAEYRLQREFYARRSDLPATRLVSRPALARSLGLAALGIKDESARFGLHAFKSAGTTFAVDVLRRRGVIAGTLACASEGNHGRAVARAAREAGCACRVYMAANVAPVRVRAIESEGAQVALVPGTYDEALHAMTRDADAHGWIVISDTSDRPDDEVSRLIMLGYTRLFDEAATQWDAPPDVIVVPGGVGGLLGAAASWAAWRYGERRPKVVAVEPVGAASLQASAKAGRPVRLDGPFDTAMAGLRCGEVSRSAFDAVRTIVDGYVGIEDEWAFDAMRRLARPVGDDAAVLTGASGAAALGGVLATIEDPPLRQFGEAVGLRSAARVLAVVSEGVTEPQLFAEVMAGRR